MREYESLNHTQWERLYHVVFIPKCRRRNAVFAVAAVPWGGVSPIGGGRKAEWKRAT